MTNCEDSHEICVVCSYFIEPLMCYEINITDPFRMVSDFELDLGLEFLHTILLIKYKNA